MPDLSRLGLVAACFGFLAVGCGGSAPPLKEPATTSTSASPAQDDGLDAGGKIVEQLPVITAESMEAGKKWGSNLAKKTLRDLGQPTE
jgi:hypothetical protein